MRLKYTQVNIAALRELIAEAPSDTVLLVPASDHSYKLATVQLGTALFHPQHGVTEDHGEAATPEEEFGKRRPVLIIT